MGLDEEVKLYVCIKPSILTGKPIGGYLGWWVCVRIHFNLHILYSESSIPVKVLL